MLGTVGSSSKSELEFWDLDFWSAEDTGRRDGQPAKEDWGAGIQTLGTADHYGVTDVEWDPSGRYLATSASAWRHTVRVAGPDPDPEVLIACVQMENGYAIWDFRGQEVRKELLDRFKQFLWRPRPRTLVTKEQQRQIRKNLREYSRAFDEEDAAEESNVSAELLAHRKRLVDEWNSWRARATKERAEGHGTVAGRTEPEAATEEIAVWIDEVVEQVEEEVAE